MKQGKVGDEEELPSLEIMTKLNMLATSRLKELMDKATPGEKSAISTIVGNIS
jgi:hypothetical protein